MTGQHDYDLLCEKVAMPESIREYFDYLYTHLDKEVLFDTDDNGYVVGEHRRSWLEHLYKRGVLDKELGTDSSIEYRAAHVSARLESFIVLEKAYWISLPDAVRDAINDRYIMNPEIWLPRHLNQTERCETILPVENCIELLEQVDSGYYFLAECNCNNYIMDCERDKLAICMHFADREPAVNSPDGRGLSKRVDKKGMIEALQYADRQGLVHKLGPKGTNICNCCACCCIHHHKAEQYQQALREDFLRTPYVIEVYQESCLRCGRCTKQCPYGALSLREGELLVDRDQCWGCGVCRVVCAASALRIQAR